MEVHARRHRSVQAFDQENAYVGKGKNAGLAIPGKRQGLAVRGVLGEVNSNVQAQRDVTVGPIKSDAPAECDKKASFGRGVIKCNYSHVQSKVDTGRALKSVILPTSRPPLRREESTAGLASKAVRSTKQVLKDVQNIKTNDAKCVGNSFIYTKKETKKTQKLPALKETSKTKEQSSKRIVKEQRETLEKLTELNISHEVELEEYDLPEDIEDIDAKDKDSPYLMAIYIKDIYRYLIELEEKYPVEPDHLKNQAVVTGKMRATLVDWLVDVQKQFSLVLETLHLAVGIIDRYLQVVPNVSRNNLQLVGVTALFIASKYEEIYAPDVADFVYVTDNAYSKPEVFRCERDIMQRLGFCLARPVPLAFLRRFIKAAHGTSKNHHMAKYFVDLCLVEYTMAHYRPSELAAAAMWLSLYLLGSHKPEAVWTRALAYYSGYTYEHIRPIVRRIAAVVLNVGQSKYQAVYNKYADHSLASVSQLPLLKGTAIHEIAKIYD